MMAGFLRLASYALLLTGLAFVALYVAPGSGHLRSAVGQSPPPPLTSGPLGDPTMLTAAAGNQAGEVDVRRIPAAHATRHWVWVVRAGRNDGRYRPWLGGNASSATISELDPGGAYRFIVIAGQRQDDGAWEWSGWTNWARGTARSAAGLPVPTPPGAARSGAEIEGVILSVDAAANSFVVRVTEYEHLGVSSQPDPITVDYDAVQSVERWLRPGRYVEAEGSYDPVGNVLRASRVEPDGSGGRRRPGRRRRPRRRRPRRRRPRRR